MGKPALRWSRTMLGTEVQRSEWRLVALFFSNLFLLLAAYYILKVIREPLVLLEGGAVDRSYARGLQAGLSLLLVPVYGLLSDRFEPARMVKWVIAVFVVCVSVFFSLGQLGVHVGFAFFVWLGLFSTLAIAQFWSLATDVLTEAQGKRLFPLVAVGGTLGGIVGAQLAALLSERQPPHHSMLVAAALLLVCALLTHVTQRTAAAHRACAPVASPPAPDRRGALALLAHDRYLRLVALSVVIVNCVNTTGDFLLAQLVAAAADGVPATARHHFVTEFYGNLQTSISALTALVQVGLVARSFSLVGVGSSLLLLPLVVVGGYGALAFAPGLARASLVKVAQDSTEYSLQNTSQQALFLGVTRAAKYKAKAAIDTLFVRFGDLLATLAIFVGAQLGWDPTGYALLNVAIGLVWLVVTLRIRQLHAR